MCLFCLPFSFLKQHTLLPIRVATEQTFAETTSYHPYTYTVMNRAIKGNQAIKSILEKPENNPGSENF